MITKAIISKTPISSKKKFKVELYSQNDKIKTIRFGAKGYSDFTKHGDKKRKDNYIARHKPRENWSKSGMKTAGFWSKHLLWNKNSLSKSARDVERNFNIDVKLN